MDKIIPYGTEVLIFEYNPARGLDQKEDIYIMGVVCDSKIVQEDVIHGSSWESVTYEVLGEDGKIYSGNYNNHIRGDFYFRTIEDHISKIKSKVASNFEKVKKVNQENLELFDAIDKLYSKKYTKQETNDSTIANEYMNNRHFKSLEENTIYLANMNAKRYKKKINRGHY